MLAYSIIEVADQSFSSVAWGLLLAVMFIAGCFGGAALFFTLGAADERKRDRVAMDKLKREELALSERVKPIRDAAAKAWMDWDWQRRVDLTIGDGLGRQALPPKPVILVGREEMDSLEQWIEQVNDDLGVYTKLDIKNPSCSGRIKVHGMEVQVVDKESYLGVKCGSKVKDY